MTESRRRKTQRKRGASAKGSVAAKLLLAPLAIAGVFAHGQGLSPGETVRAEPQAYGPTALRDGGSGPLPFARTGEAIYPGTTVVILSGLVNARNQRTRFKFQYGRTRPYAHTQYGERELSGHRTSEVSEAVGDLKPGTTYHYRIIAFNKYGFVTGKDRTFRTLERRHRATD